MAVTTELTIGPVHTLVSEQVYAMPGCAVWLNVNNGAATVEVSNDGSTFVAVSADSNGNVLVAAAFLKITLGAEILVTLRHI